jgi:hypothetical protein
MNWQPTDLLEQPSNLVIGELVANDPSVATSDPQQ